MRQFSGLPDVASWLLGSPDAGSAAFRARLRAGLFGSVPIFLGGVLNSVAVAGLAAWRQPAFAFLAWFALELSLALLRIPLILRGRGQGEQPSKRLIVMAVVLSCIWAASVGYGAFLSLDSEDWILATIVCLSASAMVCGVCLRSFRTPRLAAMMILLMLSPAAVAGLISRQPALAIISIQLPIYMATIFSAVFFLHRMMLSQIRAVADLEEAELLNRTILDTSPDYTLLLDRQLDVVFCNAPPSGPLSKEEILGANWLDLLYRTDREAGLRAVEALETERSAHITTRYVEPGGATRWFDVVLSRVADASGRFMVVGRDITHQKASEEQAVWIARHDPLTGLPNRDVLRQSLDSWLERGTEGALLIVDIDNFKGINDTLGHDAGDALLAVFANRLRSGLARHDVVARTGGDEFAILVRAASEDAIRGKCRDIYESLSGPIHHAERLITCSASVGASILSRDGPGRSEIFKAADIALYAAKEAGRAQLKIFEPGMLAEVERREAMLISARGALRERRLVPYFQPKISLRTFAVCGFEALLRWRDEHGVLRGPSGISAAFEDPSISSLLSDAMLECTLDQMAQWKSAGLDFGHVAVNLTPNDFRRDKFAEMLLGQLAKRDLPTASLQIEVTETVFLGRGSKHVEEALRTLNCQGIKIALDDFGTGYASLTHLNQHPINLLKIDRSFVTELGQSAQAEAIAAAVINLGHGLGLEIVAEGIETEVQADRLIALGCDQAQGFLYSEAVATEKVPDILRSSRKSGPRLVFEREVS